jgi:O-antigen/teichoic acid export membrane protein
LSAEDIGYYGAALRLTEFAAMVPAIFSSSLAPYIAKQAAAGETSLMEAMKLAYRVNSVFCLIPAIPMVIMPGFLVHLLFGLHFDAAIPLLMMNVGRLYLGSIGAVRSHYILNKHLYWQRVAAGLVGITLSVVLNLTLIPLYGLNGAIYSAFLSFFATTILFDVFVPQLRPNLRCLIRGTLMPWKQ